MTILSDGRTRRCAARPSNPRTPLVVDPAESPAVETVPAGPGGAALVPVLELPGVRLCVDLFSADEDAAAWWERLAAAALYASSCYRGEGERVR